MERLHLAVFQHSPEEPMGYFEDLVRQWNTPYSITRLFETGNGTIPSATHVLLLGGPMSVNDERDHPFLAGEKAAIRSWVKSGIPVLGICLGAQLIAAALGGRVGPCLPEQGWSEIRTPGSGLLSGFPKRFMAFQMHGETFEIPAGGTVLCTGSLVTNQAFRIGLACGLQFHPEITPEIVHAWTKDLPLPERDRISRDTARYLPGSRSLCQTLARRFLSQ